VVGDAAVEVGPALFFSLLIITLSFIPVFTLEAQEGRLFSPLAFTKTYAMAARPALAVTLMPVLMGYLIRGRIPDERRNPLNRVLIAIYRPLLDGVLRLARRPRSGGRGAAAASTAWPILSDSAASSCRRWTKATCSTCRRRCRACRRARRRAAAADRPADQDRARGRSVFGKAGRAETATDPAPLEMFETTIQFKPKSSGAGHDARQAGRGTRRGRQGAGPGQHLGAADPQPHRHAGHRHQEPGRRQGGGYRPGRDRPHGRRRSSGVAKGVPGVSRALAERLTGGRYVDVNIDRDAAARYGLNIADVQSVVSAAVGGENVGETVEGLQRFPINVRYPREVRDSLQKLRQLPVLTPRGARIVLGDVAELRITDGPPMLRSENARLAGWVYVDMRGRDLKSAVLDMQKAVAEQVKLTPGYSVSWSGQFEFLERADGQAEGRRALHAGHHLRAALPDLPALRRGAADHGDAALRADRRLLAALPAGLQPERGRCVGFIALAGVAAEFGVIMLLYLKQAWEARLARGQGSDADLLDAIREGAVLRVRPKAMTVAVIIAGLVPIMFGGGTGSEVMQRIAAPMVGGMVTAPLLSMFVVPAIYRSAQWWRLGRNSLCTKGFRQALPGSRRGHAVK
jgi:Cu(I)/Ag(I) efflux system membrane protein CusA/SilA